MGGGFDDLGRWSDEDSWTFVGMGGLGGYGGGALVHGRSRSWLRWTGEEWRTDSVKMVGWGIGLEVQMVLGLIVRRMMGRWFAEDDGC